MKAGGLGLRGQVELSPVAFIGALEQALPCFGGERGVCPSLAHLVAPLDAVEPRWSPLLASG